METTTTTTTPTATTTTTTTADSAILAMSDVVVVPFPERQSSVGEGSTTSSTPSAFVITPKALPDVDDQSMTQVFNYIDKYRTDLKFSFLSDSFFLVGGLGYVIMAAWDCWKPGSIHWLYRTVELGAPIVYLFNSVVDVMWAVGAQERHKVKRRMEDTWRDWRVLLDDDQSEESQEPPATTSLKKRFEWMSRLRKHAAHRRTMLAAFMFGVAAIFGVVSVLASYFHNHPASALFFQNFFDAVSVHAYLLSAIIAVSGKRTRPWLGRPSIRNPETLEDLGDLLFLIGSFVDVALSYLSFDNDKPGWPLFSSILWFLDACLYLRSDFIMADRMIVPEQERSTTLV
jgi:hypothetical protein